MRDDLQHLLRLIDQYGLAERDPRMAIWRSLIEQGRLTPGSAKLAALEIEAAIERQRDFPNLLHRPPTPEQFYQYGLPDIIYGRLLEQMDMGFGACSNAGPDHTGVFGVSGGGKTSALRRIVRAKHERYRATGRTVSFVVLDQKGGDFADLPEQLGNDWLSLSIGKGLQIGFNGPATVPTDHWSYFVAEAFCARFGLQFSFTTLLRLFKWLLPVLAQTLGTTKVLYPDAQLLLDILYPTPYATFSAKPQYLQSLIQILEQFVFGSFGATATFRGWDVVGDLIERGQSCVIDLSPLRPEVKRFIVDLIVGAIYLDRLMRGYKTDQTDVILVIDEADELISQAHSDAVFPGGSSPITLVGKQGRELGIEINLSASRIADASELLMSNVHTPIVFNQASAACRRTAARTLMLEPKAEGILSALLPGQAVLRMPATGWPHAFLGQFAPEQTRRAQPVRPYDTVDSMPARRLAELPQVEAALKNKIDQVKGATLRQARTAKRSLPDYARKLLTLSLEQPSTPVARLHDQLGRPSADTQRQVREELTARKLAQFSDVRLGQRTMALMEATQAGAELVEQPHRPLPGRGGLDHRTIQAWIIAVGAQRGYQSAIEWIVPETRHPTDACWITDAHTHVFEVICSAKSNVADHLQAALLANGYVDQVTLVTTQKKMHARLQQTLTLDRALDAVRDRYDFDIALNYYGALWPCNSDTT